MREIGTFCFNIAGIVRINSYIFTKTTYPHIWGNCPSRTWPMFVKMRIVVSTGVSSSTLRIFNSSSNTKSLQNAPGKIADKIWNIERNKFLNIAHNLNNKFKNTLICEYYLTNNSTWAYLQLHLDFHFNTTRIFFFPSLNYFP